MPKFNYVAMDSRGKETKGTLEVTNQNEAIGRLKEMGFFPTKVVEIDKTKEKSEPKAKDGAKAAAKKGGFSANRRRTPPSNRSLVSWRSRSKGAAPFPKAWPSIPKCSTVSS